MLRQIALNIVLSAVIVMIGLMVYHDKYAPKIYALDLRKFVAAQQKMLIDGNLNDKDMDDNFDKLDKKIKEKGSNAVILTSVVVIKGDEIEMD